jgi:1,4-dihydroxy-2-naphthoyl-CoA hydrolase
MSIDIAKNLVKLRAAIGDRSQKTLMDALGIEITHVDEKSIRGTMPVDHRTVQYYRYLHGGANVALAETLASIASAVHIDMDNEKCVGLEINANHIRGANSGMVYGEAKPIHIGKKTQVWGIELKNEAGKILCISRCTMAIVPLSS